MATSYNSKGQKLNSKQLKEYKQKGWGIYTQEALETKYGASLGIIQQLGNMRGLLSEAPGLYKQRSDEELAAAADAQYAADSLAAKNIAQGQYNSNLQALEQQRAGLDAPYQAQVAQAQKQTAQNLDSLSGSMLTRGLGRSSYAGALQQTTQQAGANAVGGIMADKTAKSNDIGAQMQNLGSNLSGTLATIDATKNSSVRSAIDQMRSDDYNKSLASSQARNDYILGLLDRKKKVSKSGGSSGGSSRSSSGSGSSGSSGSGGGGNAFLDWWNSITGQN